MRLCFDSTTPARSIPSGAQMVGGYTSGLYPTWPVVCQQWPHAVHVSIAINAAHDAQVLDVEKGDADPADAPGWCQRQRGRGQVPTVYCNTSTWPSVQAAFHLAGVPLPLFWRADYNGRPALEMGEVAHQYRSDTAQNLDYSVVADVWPGVDPQEEDMAALLFDASEEGDAYREWFVCSHYVQYTGAEPDPQSLGLWKLAIAGGAAGLRQFRTGLLDSPAAVAHRVNAGG